MEEWVELTAQEETALSVSIDGAVRELAQMVVKFLNYKVGKTELERMERDAEGILDQAVVDLIDWFNDERIIEEETE